MWRGAAQGFGGREGGPRLSSFFCPREKLAFQSMKALPVSVWLFFAQRCEGIFGIHPTFNVPLSP